MELKTKEIEEIKTVLANIKKEKERQEKEGDQVILQEIPNNAHQVEEQDSDIKEIGFGAD